MKKQIILCFHAVGENKQIDEIGNSLYSVALHNFSRQMEYLYNTRQKVTLTFDDGDITNYTNALPVLQKYSFSAYFFIIGGFVGRPGYMDWQQIRQLQDQGHVIGSHGMSHRILTLLDEAQVEQELEQSRETIAENIGREVQDLSVPRAFYNPRILALAQKAGYLNIYTSDFNDFSRGEVRAYGRRLVKQDCDLAKFQRLLQKDVPVKDKLEESGKKLLRFMLGDRGYDGLRSRIIAK